MIKGDHGPTKLLHALTWGAFDHASHAPQVRACNYYLRTHIILICFVKGIVLISIFTITY